MTRPTPQQIANKAVKKAGGTKVPLRKNTFSAKKAVKELEKKQDKK